MRWQRFFYVTLPQLASVLFVIVLLRSIWMFTKFDTPWLMIQGGGAETYIRTLPVYTYSARSPTTRPGSARPWRCSCSSCLPSRRRSTSASGGARKKL